MFYRLRRNLNTRRFDRQISGILETKPIDVRDAPWTIVSMVANRDVPMYLAAIKSFYLKIGSGKIVAIVDRDMPQDARDTLARHLPGIEFVILEDIPTAPCQRGGTWERLLYCLDRSRSEYTIQLDSDTLTVADMPEVVDCLHANRAFTMTDGFARVSMNEAADQAQSTPRNMYIGIIAEAAFSRYQGAENLHYIRGSSGFAGFAKGGFTRADMVVFHQQMEKLVGEKKWREWGSEQCGSNFAVANSPDPLILPYPEYTSFDHHVPRATAKFYHFIGRYRFAEGYFARRIQETIAQLTPRAAKIAAPRESLTRTPDTSSLAGSLTRKSALKYGTSFLIGRSQPLELEVRRKTKVQVFPGPAPKFRLLGERGRALALESARDVFVSRIYASPVWMPEQRVKLVVDIGAGIGLSCLWWLSIYWRTKVMAFETNRALADEISVNARLNGYDSRVEIHQTEAQQAEDMRRRSPPKNVPARDINVRVVENFLSALDGRVVDILKIDMAGSERDLLNAPGFATLKVRALVLKWRRTDSSAHQTRDTHIRRLNRLGYRTYQTVESDTWGVIWGYKLP